MTIWSTVLLAAAIGSAGSSEGVSLLAFECGRLVQRDSAHFSDTYRFRGEGRVLIASCYLIRHPKGMLLWDAGLDPGLRDGTVKASPGRSLGATIPEQLAAIDLEPGQVTHLGISHRHLDHMGGASSFPGAELLIGKPDWDGLRALGAEHEEAAPLAHWLSGRGKVTPISGDMDVFGDGTVSILAMPGHTRGHSVLLIKLASGHVLLSGDQYHFRESRAVASVPSFNWNRAETLASHDRFEEIARNLKARVIIQHDPRDLARLPRFPEPLR